MDHPSLSLTVADLSLSVRSRNCLTGVGVRDVRELVRMTRRELLNVRNLGRISVLDIERALGEHGLRLGMLEDELLHSLAFNDPVAVEELAAFLHAIAAVGCTEVATLVGRRADDLLAEEGLDAESLGVLQDGLLKWGISLGLPVAEAPGPEGQSGELRQRDYSARVANFREELRDRVAHLLRLKPESWRDCFFAYYGLDGPYPTLDVIGRNGSTYGFGKSVTRERVRQVLARARTALEAAEPTAGFEHWDCAVELARAETPTDPDALFSLLGYEPPSRVELAFRRLNEVAEIFELRLPFEIRSLGRGETLLFFASEPGSSAWVKRLRDLPPSPFGSVAEIAEAVGCEEEPLRRVVAASRGWEFLDTSNQFLWRRPNLPPKNFAKTRNAILTSLCKVFSVPGRASSADLAMSLGRDRMVRRGGPPFHLPIEVVEGIARKSGLFSIAAGKICRKENVAHWESLSERDIALLNVVSRHGSVLSSRDLYSSLVRDGLSKGNAGQVVQFSPFLVHTQSGVGETEGIYKFVLDVHDEVPTELQPAVSPDANQSQTLSGGASLSDAGFRLDVSARTLQFGTFFGPEAAVLEDGTWTIVVDDEELGEITVSGRQIKGLNVVIAALHLKKGDRLELLPSEATRVIHCIRPSPPQGQRAS